MAIERKRAEPRKPAGTIGTSVDGAQVEDTCGSKHFNPRRKRRLSPQSTVGCPFHFNFRRADLKKPQFASSVSTRSESAQNVPVSDSSAIRLSVTPETPTHELVPVQFRAFRPRERGVGIAPERFRRRRELERERRLCDPRRLPNKLR
ncbi:hypothetical protein R1flu_012232 [Riccia fluitans]|uniref:Uncharacterized protein n=1 Tax=Riccia fluitans TaxID=41844 RepID=A0ABD1ZB02_9MARC